mgnify:CR=1 FL=1
MISNEERRKFAENLRYIAQHPPEWATSACAIAEVFDANYPLWKDSGELFDILADLIDRPAIKPEPSGRAYWRCPRCGAFNYRSAVTDCCGVIPAHYCANCGAEVVPHAERRD